MSWLKDILDENRRVVDSWPDWKKGAAMTREEEVTLKSMVYQIVNELDGDRILIGLSKNKVYVQSKIVTGVSAYIDAHDAEQRQVIEQQAQQNATLREVLGKLIKEIDGILGIGEEQIRNIVGNTNVNVLHVKIATAQQALKEVKP